jgi:protein-L-isoaspartate O-methyltransferase
MTHVFTKLLSGADTRKTRFHDEKGNFVGYKNIALNGTRATATGILRVTAGIRPEKPWISYAATKYIKSKISKKSRILEFGSGMSTIWYAKNGGQVYSVEDYEPWYKKIKLLIETKNYNNIKYQYEPNEDAYASYMQNDTTGFDLIMIDGSHRSKCAEQSAKLLRPGGLLYLDNSDKDSTLDGGDMRFAESFVRKFATNCGATILEFTDFAPTQFFAQQGICMQMPNRDI